MTFTLWPLDFPPLRFTNEDGDQTCTAVVWSLSAQTSVHIFSVSLFPLDRPQNTSVSISPSGEIVEGDSVTLRCSSDSNPPALNFSWFKENQSSAVGSGQSFIISSFNSSHSGRYYCEAQNQYGSQRSAFVSVFVKGIHYKQTLLCLSCLKVCPLPNYITISIIHMFKDFNKNKQSHHCLSS